MNKQALEIAKQSGIWFVTPREDLLDDYAKLIVQQCIDKIETYRIPVGNSASGELACEWTYAALKEIRDDIKECFGITDA
jgi:hypothetical protein